MSCRLICTTDKSQLASITYYSLFAARIICRRLSCFCMQWYQSVTQYSISIPGPVTYLSVTVTSHMLPILTTTPRYPDSVIIVCHVCFDHHNFVAVDWIASPRSGNTGGTARVLWSEQETIGDGNYSRTSRTRKLPSSFSQVLFYVPSPNRDPPAIITAVMLRYVSLCYDTAIRIRRTSSFLLFPCQ